MVGSHIIIKASWWWQRGGEKNGGGETKKKGRLKKMMAQQLWLYSKWSTSWEGKRGMGEQHPCMELGQKNRKSLKEDKVFPRRTCPEPHCRRQNSSFLRSQKQHDSQGCRKYLIFISWEMGFTWFALGQAQDLCYHAIILWRERLKVPIQ